MENIPDYICFTESITYKHLNARMDYEELFVININEEQQTYTLYLI